ncbi:MAG: Rpn family recombination-promoting nuclease/putative transposase, partial [Bacteroidota bacterium]
MHDYFIRAILADRTNATDYFQAFLPENISRQLDFATLEQLPDTYLSEALKKNVSDIVYTCQKKDAAELIKVCLLVEHKSYPDRYTPVQIGGYIFSALQKQVANKERLSVVLPVLLYHGRGKWQYQTLAGLFENLASEWRPFVPDFSYIYNNLGEVADAQVIALKNKFLAASLLALKHSFEKKWLAENALRMLILTEQASEGLQKSFVVYMFGRSELKEDEINSLFESLSRNLKNTVMSTLDIFIEKGRVEGIEKGIRRGIEKGI